MPAPATEERARITVEALSDFYVRAFTRAGLPHEDAETTARILMGSDVHGIESHGAPLAHGYVRRLRNGAINPQPNIRVVSEFPGTLTLDGDRGMGPVVATYAMRQAIEKARENGVGTVTVRNSNHFAATCNYPLMAAAAGLRGHGDDDDEPERRPDLRRGGHPRHEPDRHCLPRRQQREALPDRYVHQRCRLGQGRCASPRGESRCRKGGHTTPRCARRPTRRWRAT